MCDQTQGFLQVRQARCQLSHTSTPSLSILLQAISSGQDWCRADEQA